MEVQPPYFAFLDLLHLKWMGRKFRFANNEIYHVYNRGADKRMVFLNDHDYLRFLHGLFEFNTTEPAINLKSRFGRNPHRITKDLVARGAGRRAAPRRLVDVLIFALMPNHFHLLLQQRLENGLSDFMHKIGTGYTLYFNQKYKRTGCLFQGRFKAAHIEENTHFLHLPHYIHANPLKLNRKQQTPEKFLREYRWSSHMDYCGWKNFPSLTQRKLLLDFFGGEEQYRRSIEDWLKRKEENSRQIKSISLE